MCGRFTQPGNPAYYAEMMRWMRLAGLPVEPIANYNAAPGVAHWTMRIFNEAPYMEPIVWGYLSPWAEKKSMTPAINARLDKLLTPYYRSLMKTGRIIVPAHGWYEWTGEKGNKQPWYIKAKDGKPLFFAALTNRDPGKPDQEDAGFVIVTEAAAGGMVDVHARRPLVLSAEDARLWMDPGISYEQAEQIARTHAIGEEAFEWQMVGRDVNKVSRHDAGLIEPIRVEPAGPSLKRQQKAS